MCVCVCVYVCMCMCVCVLVMHFTHVHVHTHTIETRSKRRLNLQRREIPHYLSAICSRRKSVKICMHSNIHYISTVYPIPMMFFRGGRLRLLSALLFNLGEP